MALKKLEIKLFRELTEEINKEFNGTSQFRRFSSKGLVINGLWMLYSSNIMARLNLRWAYPEEISNWYDQRKLLIGFSLTEVDGKNGCSMGVARGLGKRVEDLEYPLFIPFDSVGLTRSSDNHSELVLRNEEIVSAEPFRRGRGFMGNERLSEIITVPGQNKGPYRILPLRQNGNEMGVVFMNGQNTIDPGLSLFAYFRNPSVYYVG